jgi:hypothetical protein
VYFLNLAYSQKPPDDFINIIGRLLDANLNAAKRKEERIVLTPETIRGLGLKAKETRVAIGTETRACIVRDISFSGVKILMLGANQSMSGQPARIAIAFEEEEKPFILAGAVARFEPVQGRPDIGALAIRYDDAKVPIQYKVRINGYEKRWRLAEVAAVGADGTGIAPAARQTAPQPQATPDVGAAAAASEPAVAPLDEPPP